MLRLLIILMVIGVAGADIVGGWHDIRPIDKTTHRIANDAVGLYDDDNTWGLAQRLVKLKHARSQVTQRQIIIHMFAAK